MTLAALRKELASAFRAAPRECSEFDLFKAELGADCCLSGLTRLAFGTSEDRVGGSRLLHDVPART